MYVQTRGLLIVGSCDYVSRWILVSYHIFLAFFLLGVENGGALYRERAPQKRLIRLDLCKSCVTRLGSIRGGSVSHISGSMSRAWMQSSTRAGIPAVAHNRPTASAAALLCNNHAARQDGASAPLPSSQVLRLTTGKKKKKKKKKRMAHISIAAEWEVKPRDNSHAVRQLVTRPWDWGGESRPLHWSVCRFAASRFRKGWLCREPFRCLVAPAPCPHSHLEGSK